MVNQCLNMKTSEKFKIINPWQKTSERFAAWGKKPLHILYNLGEVEH